MMYSPYSGKFPILYLGKCIVFHHILEVGNLHSNRYENLKSYMFFAVLHSLAGLMSACTEYKSNVDRFKSSKITHHVIVIFVYKGCG